MAMENTAVVRKGDVVRMLAYSNVKGTVIESRENGTLKVQSASCARFTTMASDVVIVKYCS
jgi:hypothetical protein